MRLQVLQRILNARQFGLKLIANVTYGYTAAGFSGRMPMAELADSIVQVIPCALAPPNEMQPAFSRCMTMCRAWALAKIQQAALHPHGGLSAWAGHAAGELLTP